MHNQFSLLSQKKFLPFFVTQALGAFNDNVYKNALMLLMAFGAASQLPFDTNFLMNLAAGLFILPFLLFSGVAGRIADTYDMDLIIRRAKLAEIAIMSAAAIALLIEAYSALIVLLFLMGTQSAFFGPVKYAILPRTLHSQELVGGNALVEMGTFVAILLGTIMGGLLVGLENANQWIALSVLSFAVLGYIASRSVPATPNQQQDMTISWNIFSQTWSTFKVSHKYRDVFLSMMAISWFWFMGASYLTQIPNYTKTNLQGNNEVVTLLLAIFSIGVAMGSLLCEKLSAKRIELGIVPIGALGLSIFGIHLFFNTPALQLSELMGFGAFIQHPANLLVLLDFALIGFFGGLYSVPLMALVQKRSDDNEKAQTIAALNILNALFMVVSAISGILLLSMLGLSIPQYLLLVSIANLVFTLYIFISHPEFLVRLTVYLISHLRRVQVTGLEHLGNKPDSILLAQLDNISDTPLLAAPLQNPVHYLVDKTLWQASSKHWFLSLTKARLLENDEQLMATIESINTSHQQLCLLMKSDSTEYTRLSSLLGDTQADMAQNILSISLNDKRQVNIHPLTAQQANLP